MRMNRWTLIAAIMLVTSFVTTKVAHAGCSPQPYGLIGDKWRKLGGIQSELGDCATAEIGDGYGGRWQNFANGYIDWDGHSSEAYYVAGIVAQKYSTLWNTDWLPIADEQRAPNTFGRYIWLRGLNGGHAAIYFNELCYYYGNCAAFVIYGDILVEWGRVGYEDSQLGYPTSDEHNYTDYGSVPGERIQSFDNGFIRWRPDGSILNKLYPGHCLSETGSYLADQGRGVGWCP